MLAKRYGAAVIGAGDRERRPVLDWPAAAPYVEAVRALAEQLQVTGASSRCSAHLVT